MAAWFPSYSVHFWGGENPRKSNFIFFTLPHLSKTQKPPPPPLHLSRQTTQLRSSITCACFWEINWNVRRGDIACLHFSSSLYWTICHVSKPESESGFITHPGCSHRPPGCALNGSDSADDIAFADDRRRRGASAPPPPLHSTGCPASPSALHSSTLNSDAIQKSMWGRQGDQQGHRPPSQLLSERKHKSLSANFKMSHVQGNLSLF